MSDFFTVLSGVLSADKDTRTQSEAAFTTLMTSSPTETALQLVNAMGAEETIASLSIVLFRKKVIDTGVYTTFTDAIKAQIRTSMIALVTPTHTTTYLKKLGDVLTNLANTDGWVNEFFGYIAAWEKVEELKEFSLYLLELAVEFPKLMDTLQQNAASVIELLGSSLQHSNPTVVLSGLNSLASFLSGLTDETQVLKFAYTASPMLTVFTTVLSQPELNVDKVKNTLTCLAELTETFPRFWKETLTQLTTVMTTISNSTQLDNEIRSGSVEVLVTLTQKAPGMIKKTAGVIEEIMKTALQLTYEVDNVNDIEAWTTDDTDENVTTNEPFSLGKDLLNKASYSLGAETVLPYFMTTIPTLINSAEWTHQHTGLLALGLIANGCHEQFEKNLNEILTMILPFVSSANPRLQWATATTLGLLCTEFEPTIETAHHARLIPAMLTLMTSSTNVKVQTRGTSALVNYTRGLLAEDDVDPAESLTQYASTVLQTLATLLQQAVTTNNYTLMLEVLNAISTTASALQSAFAPYYNQFMPALKTLVTIPTTTTQQQEIRATCIRCIGYMIESISEVPENYTEDAKSIMNGLVQLKSSLDSEDPATLAINEVISNFADCLKEQFEPYMHVFMPELLTRAQANVDITFTDADEGQDLAPGMNAVTFDMKGEGKKQLAINTTALQHKIKACRILYDLVSSMGKAFAPYIEQTISTLTPLFAYAYNADIRKYSIRTVACTVGATKDTFQAEALLRVLFPLFTTTLQGTHLSPEDIKRILKALLFVLESVENVAVVGLGYANELAQTLSNQTKAVFTRKVERSTEIQKYTDPELYSEELEVLNEEETTDNKILRTTMEVVGKLLKNFRKEFQATFLTCFKDMYAQLFFKEKATDEELLSAICIFDDYVEFTQDLMWDSGRSRLTEQMLKFANHKNADIRQSAVYGVGVCAQTVDQATFAPYVNSAVEAVRTIINDGKARSDEYNVATDCAVGALGKLAIFQRNDLIEEWLNNLPIKAEPEEAQNVHRLFLNNFANLKNYPRSMTVVQELSRLVREEPTSEVLDKTEIEVLSQIIATN
ncbi:unnamed protein product [Blepharisma stoltei]|uniref:Uncharacterized protein n=1 Tax=Blepharisma stoltei TaxID=1481888 RepID=A0AAU9JBV5_9CILI|nr:unnamed protein product [Blepharisma stoltei]